MNATTHNEYLMSNYGRFPVAFVRGKGVVLWDDQERAYLDFISGIGVNNLGHAPPRVVEAVCQQVATLTHTSNLYRVPLQEELAKRLAETCFAEKIFFCNSGAEANEAAIKLARKFMKDQGQAGRFEIITMDNSFHGRTFGALTATAQSKVHRGFEPLLPGFRYVPFNNLEAVEQAISGYTAAILVEPIQGESGVRVPGSDYLIGLRSIADRHGLLLIFDEVQTGMGRTGKMWAHQWSPATPDIMTSAKAIASGLPMGACLATARVGGSFSPGTHGSTFGGTPLVCAAALATLDTLLYDGVLPSVTEKGIHFRQALSGLRSRHKEIIEVRGVGLMTAMELNVPVEEVVSICLSRGLLVSGQMGTTIRFLPPLIVTHAEIDQAVAILDGVLADLF